ncbi:S-adenosyl-L-methionine-dependent methyltransferase [Pleurotus eryngii]|uniref:Protein-lysine N-methyltransferase EFM6 n=1 Tax=Pleurotus eryngii TaxID=5323 RepID=A0A9P5ZWG1_PLEER|nr:S-adenosyl-L-methionine-dependent methyltransferase [Pleurotus eryngii]
MGARYETQVADNPLHGLALEEDLDIRDPLRHYMRIEPSDSTVVQSYSMLPEQRYSVQNDLIKLPLGQRSDTPEIALTLAISAREGCGGVAWPAGLVLANHLIEKGSDFLKGKTILELGSGTGLVGLAAAILGGHVWITDQAPLLDTMRRNVILNDLSQEVTVAELDWGLPIPESIPKPDIILAADCVYFEPAFPLLVKTLADLSDTGTEILFCYKKRRKADKRFFVLLKKVFTWTEVLDDPARSIYSRDAISLLRLVKR